MINMFLYPMFKKYITLAVVASILQCHSSISFATHQDKNSNDKKLSSRPILASMTWNQQQGLNLVVDEIKTSTDTVGWVNFTNAINQTGWSYLEVKTHENFPDKIQVCFKILLYFK